MLLPWGGGVRATKKTPKYATVQGVYIALKLKEKRLSASASHLRRCVFLSPLSTWDRHGRFWDLHSPLPGLPGHVWLSHVHPGLLHLTVNLCPTGRMGLQLAPNVVSSLPACSALSCASIYRMGSGHRLCGYWATVD